MTRAWRRQRESLQPASHRHARVYFGKWAGPFHSFIIVHYIKWSCHIRWLIKPTGTRIMPCLFGQNMSCLLTPTNNMSMCSGYKLSWNHRNSTAAPRGDLSRPCCWTWLITVGQSEATWSDWTPVFSARTGSLRAIYTTEKASATSSPVPGDHALLLWNQHIQILKKSQHPHWSTTSFPATEIIYFWVDIGGISRLLEPAELMPFSETKSI